MSRASFLAGGAASAVSPTFSISGVGERMLQSVMELWKRKYPKEVIDYRRELTLLRETKYKGTGMSLGGTQMLKATIPTRPWMLINKIWPGFWESDGGVDLFLKTFSSLRVRDPK